jgi:DNA-binding Xre family transcriptional regulator
MNQFTGSNFDDFLEQEGLLEEVSAQAHKRLLVLQLKDIMLESNLTKKSLAEKLNTSRSQLDRILDPENTSITIEVLERVAHAVGKKLRIEFA